MKKNRSLKHQKKAGAAILMIVFLLLILLPLTMILVKWSALHLRGSNRGRIHMDEYYSGITATNAALLSAISWTWDNTLPQTNSQVFLGSGTVISVQITHVGTP